MAISKAELSSMLVTCSLALALSGCGGGGSDIAVISSSPGAASPFSHAVQLRSMDYQAVRGLYGTGIGGTLSPADLNKHYNFPTAFTGSGQTIAIVAAPGSGNIANDLNAFSNYYQLPQCNSANPCFQKIDLSNGAKVSRNDDWNVEIALDVEWAHAMAPSAKILLVVAKSSSMADMMAAVQTAAEQSGVVAVSMSWGTREYSWETTAAYDGVFKNYQANFGIVFLASSGDSGNNGSNQSYPAASPFVTAVGGTSIKSVGYAPPSATSEIAWIYGGGGESLYEGMPSYQTAFLADSQILTLNKGKRAIPDVAYVADSRSSPVGVYINGSWYAVGGTSAGAPQWSAIAALAADRFAQSGKSSLQSLVKSTAGGFNGLIYQAKLDQAGFFDITAGSDNTGRTACALCSATHGYDDVTGLGVPNVSNLLDLF
jgi:subtilase family serine protease